VTGDHLGSTRVVTSGAADLQPGCAVFRQDYLPFGEQILTSGGQPRASATGGTPCTANGYLTLAMPLREQFTGQQIDPESTLNFFQVRYFAGGAGRFMSPDPASTFVADPSSPQSWNLYGYVLNNPLAYIDPTGLDACNNGVDADGNPCFSVTGTGSSGSGGSDGGSSGGGGLDCFFSPFLCGGGPGGPGAGPGGPGGTPVFTTTVTTTAPGSQSKPTPTFGSCMESHASDFSMAGFLNNGLAAAGRTNLQPGNTFLGSAIGGNNLTGAYFAIFGNSNQSTSNALTTAANQGLVGDVGLVGAIGTNLTSGARTSSIFSLNLAGKPGTGAQVLARSPALRKTLGRIGTVGKITTIIDAGLALGEAIDCAAGVLR
jgi:RHS repeat-associated protein